MLTVEPDRLLSGGESVLDVGCGEGRHTHAAALVDDVTAVGLDLDRERVVAARDGFRETIDAGDGCEPTFLSGDAFRLPFPAETFDVVICSEVLEHLPEYERAIDEFARVLAPDGRLAVSVPRSGPERICWRLSEAYHEVDGGHVRVFEREQLRGTIEERGFRFVDSTHRHAFHSPYWWLKCLWWERDERGEPPAPLSAYERFLEWAEFEAPPAVGRLERGLDRLLGKSLVLYFEKP